MIAQALLKLVGVSTGPVVDYFKDKAKLKQELALTKIKGQISLEVEKERNAAEWAKAHIDNSGWKDEYVLVILSIPYIGSFIPGASDYILEGFKVLEQTPEWYRWLSFSIMAAIYGIKPAWDKFKK